MRLYRDAQQLLQVCAKELGKTEERLASEIIREALTAYVQVEQTTVISPAALKSKYPQSGASTKAPF